MAWCSETNETPHSGKETPYYNKNNQPSDDYFTRCIISELNQTTTNFVSYIIYIYIYIRK